MRPKKLHAPQNTSKLVSRICVGPTPYCQALGGEECVDVDADSFVSYALETDLEGGGGEDGAVAVQDGAEVDRVALPLLGQPRHAAREGVRVPVPLRKGLDAPALRGRTRAQLRQLPARPPRAYKRPRCLGRGRKFS